MTFPFNIYLVAITSAFLTALVSLPLWRKWCLRIGLIDDPGHRKIHGQPVPLAGGLAVMTGVVVPLLMGSGLLWLEQSPQSVMAGPTTSLLRWDAKVLLHHGLSRRATELAGIVFGAAAILLLGWLDDKHELRARTKFTGQFIVAAFVAASGVRITLFIPDLFFSYTITILWIIAVINAFNFMDNMNGLCAGLGAIGAWYFAIVAAADGQYLVGIVAFLTFGALLGFLPYNFPRARAFLGDSGSHLVGYLLSVLAILPHFYNIRHPRRSAVLIPLLVLAIPLLDLIWVVILRWCIGQPFYRGDNNHLSHRLVRRGLSRSQAVLVICFSAALIGGLLMFC